MRLSFPHPLLYTLSTDSLPRTIITEMINACAESDPENSTNEEALHKLYSLQWYRAADKRTCETHFFGTVRSVLTLYMISGPVAALLLVRLSVLIHF